MHKLIILATVAVSAIAVHAAPVAEWIDGDVELFARNSNSSLAKRQSGCTASSNGPPAGLPSKFPQATGTRSCTAPVSVTGVFDGGLYRYDRGAGYRDPNNCKSIEPGSADTIFLLEDGATLQNVIIGQEVKDAVYCLGSCTLKNVWFERTCEDSVSFKNPTTCTTCTMRWTGGAVSGFTDKAVQHNGAGTAYLTDIDVYYSGTGKFYRSCGGCGYPVRNSVFSNIRVHSLTGTARGEAFAGINDDKGDTARFSQIYIPNYFPDESDFPICKKFGTDTYGPDGSRCIYSASDVIKYNDGTGGAATSTTRAATSTTRTTSTTRASTTTTRTTSTTRASTTTTRTTSTTRAATTTTSSSCSALYGQCGGIGWTGPKCCSSGSCKFSNDYYSQCL